MVIGNQALPPVRTSGQQEGDPTGDQPHHPFNPDPQTPPWQAKGGIEPDPPRPRKGQPTPGSGAGGNGGMNK